MPSFTFTTTIKRDDDEIEVSVTYHATKAYPATHEQPAEPSMAVLGTASFVGVDAATMPSPLTDAEYEALEKECAERFVSDAAEYAAELGDYRREQARDDALDAS